jgi:hypothetical protein
VRAGAVAGVMLRSLGSMERGWAVDLLVESHMWFAVGFDAVMRAAACMSRQYAREFASMHRKAGILLAGLTVCSSCCLVLIAYTI